MSVYRIDRQFSEPEFYASEALAKAREVYLRLKGIACVLWCSEESQGPFVEPLEESA